ncbi:MAG: exopolyphosphatase, partial [Gammaproteobacteria bacterium]|nr:exopolyphosphatase [Gammaproteobacteria bacterium]
MAAIDLGSNSFHMKVARFEAGRLIVVDRMREMVRLAAGLESDGTIDKAVQERAIDCLERFGQRIRDMHADTVRVVATNTFRKARKAKKFKNRAEEALGHTIEVVSGREEARLVYSGVAHSSPQRGEKLLV